MKIALAQTRPEKGDILANLQDHLHWIQQASDLEADLILFPELSLTGYEPTLAKKLAASITDQRLQSLADFACNHRMIIGAGLPIQTAEGIQIGLVLFYPEGKRDLYGKHFLHADEEPYFVPGAPFSKLLPKQTALAIYYELSVEAHTQRALDMGAKVYLASVAKTTSGMEKSSIRLQALAQKHQIHTLIVNSVGPSDNFIGAGGSAAWNPKGELVGQLSATEPGLLVVEV